LVPHLAAWCKTQMDGALTAAGMSAAAVGFDKLAQVGVLYRGLEVLGSGPILTGLVLAAGRGFALRRECLGSPSLPGRRCRVQFLRLDAQRVGRISGHAHHCDWLRDCCRLLAGIEPA